MKNLRHFLAGNSRWDHPDMVKTGMLKGLGRVLDGVNNEIP